MEFYDALGLEGGFETYIFRHEQGAVHAADAYGRITRKPGVVLVTSGPGATNTVTGIANAYLDSSPLMVITGQVPTTVFGRDAFQETDIVGVVAPITKFAYQVKNPSEAIPAIRTAYKLAYIGRPGPTLVDIPRDIQFRPCNNCDDKTLLPIDFNKYIPQEPNRDAIRKAAKLLMEAERPVMLIGTGIYWSQAWEEALGLAKMLMMPIVTTLPGKTSIPSNHPLVLGPVGMHGRPEADAALANADVVLAIGTRFSDRTVGRFYPELAEKKIIHIDIDPSEIGKNTPTQIGIVGDAKKVLSILIEELNVTTGRNSKFLEWLMRIRKHYEEAMEKLAKELKSFAPWKVLKLIRQIAPPNTITVTGVGSHQMWSEAHWDVYIPGTWITSAGLGTMGFGIPAALGAKVAARNNPVLCIDGDGSFQMTMNNLALIREYNLPITIVIFDNRALMLVKHWQIFLYNKRVFATEFHFQPDFVKIAEAYDIEGIRPSNYKELEKWVRWSLRNNEPIIIDVTIDNEKDIVLPWVKPGKWLTEALLPKGMENVSLVYKD